MDPAPLLADELDEQPDARAEVTPPMEIDVSPDDMEAPYLRVRTFTDDANIATPTPSLDDLTHLAVAVPRIPQQALRKSPPPSPADGGADLVDVLVELGNAGDLTAEPLSKNRSRVSLSRPWLVGMGMLAFAAGLLTAAAARVVATPVRTGVATAVATPSASADTKVNANANANVAPTKAAPPVFVAAASVDPPAAEPAIEAHETIVPAAVPTAMAAPAPKTTVTGASSGRARAKAVGGSTRVRSRASARARIDARPEARPEGRLDARDDGETSVATPAAHAEVKGAAAPHRAPNWVDPFAE